jgi:AcrR family transcriptional regulator
MVMGTHASVPDDQPLTLRERKKLRTHRTLADRALRLFLDKGFHETTLDELTEAVEVSKRTFFRNYTSKEHVAMAAEYELWDAYVAEVTERELHGPVLTILRDALTTAILGLGEDWDRRFIATRGLAARTPALRDHSIVASINAQERLVDVLEDKLGIDSRDDLRLRILAELALAAWRCGAKNWVRRARHRARRPDSDIKALIHRVEEAFDAIPASLDLTAP